MSRNPSEDMGREIYSLIMFPSLYVLHVHNMFSQDWFMSTREEVVHTGLPRTDGHWTETDS